ncbi:ATP-binding protein, partial [Jiangella rhizosphaerae]
TLDELALGERVFFLSVPLRPRGRGQLARESMQAAWTDLADRLAMPRRAPSAGMRQEAGKRARAIEQAIPAAFRPRPVTPAQMAWLHGHAQQRGLYIDAHPDPAGAAALGEQLLVRSAASLPSAILDEGGQSDVVDRSVRGWSPLARRFVKVTGQDAPERPSYQVLLALADVPADGMVFPGSEFLGNVDDAGVDADFAMRLNVRSSEEVAAKNRRAVAGLNDQFAQREGELSTGPHMLDQAAADLTEYQAQLERDKDEVEVETTVVFAVADTSAEAAQERAALLAGYYAGAGYKLVQPLGGQEALWWAMVPGTPVSRVVREFAQITTSNALSVAVPVVSTALGDESGPVLALNISTGQTGVVHHDPAGAATKLDVSGSLAIAGELGAGKSVALKKIASDAADRGGRFIAVDRTESGEWVTMARAIADATVVDVVDPRLSLDPLRVFGAQAGGRIAQSFLTPLLNVSPTSDRGVLLSDVLDPAYLAAQEIRGLGDLVRHLMDGCQLAGAVDLGRLMNVFARKDFGRVIFDGALPPLPLAARAIVFWTRTLELPDRDELQHAHLFEQMKLEKVFGRAVYALMAAVSRQICFSDRTELAVFVVDEAHHMTSSPEGERELTAFVRDGRKHQAAVALGSHDPEADFGDATLRGLIPTRILMRHRDHTLARRGLAWLDLDPADETLVELITQHTSPVDAALNAVPAERRGEALMRDPLGRVGRIKVLLPARPERRQAIGTTPPAAVAGGSRGSSTQAGGA